jgi:predicted amidohydrolase
MWLSVAAGVLHFPTTERPWDTINVRLGLLKTALTELTQYRNAQMAAKPGPMWKNHDGRPSMILVAPEYMFLKEGYEHPKNDLQAKQNRFLEASDHQRIVEAFKAISATYGKQLVFVPGTIASRAPIPGDSPGASEAITSAKAKVVAGANYIQGQLGGYSATDRMNYGEAGPLGPNPSRSPMKKLQGLDNMLTKNAKGQKCYLASNVAYMFHNGRLVGTYQKRADFHEVLPLYAKEDTVFVPGIKPGRATVGGINFGIEVCLDHVWGVLSKAPTVTGTKPRIHLICSASVDSVPSKLLVEEGGYVMHASSSEPATQIQRQLKGLHDVKDPQHKKVGAGRLTMAMIEIDHHGL